MKVAKNLTIETLMDVPRCLSLMSFSVRYWALQSSHFVDFEEINTLPPDAIACNIPICRHALGGRENFNFHIVSETLHPFVVNISKKYGMRSSTCKTLYG